MKSLIYFLVTLLIVTKTYSIGFSDQITIGSNYYTVGYNLNLNDYPAGTAFNINDPSNTTLVHSVIQTAITTIGQNGGGTIHLKTGTYNCIKNIELTNNLHFKGDGMDVTNVRLADYAPSFIVGNSKRSGFIRGRSLRNVIISDMTIDGNKVNQYYDADSIYGRYGIFTEGSFNIWFDYVRVTNFQGYGFDPHGWKSRGIWGVNLTITNCLADKNNIDGFTLDQTDHIFVSDCIAWNNGRHGFNIVTGSKHVTVVNCTASNNGFYDPHGGSGCGFTAQNNQLLGTANVTFKYNYATFNKKAAFCLNDVYDINISHNSADTSCTCLNVVSVRGTEFSNNSCITQRFYVTTNTITVENPQCTSQNMCVYDNNYTKISKCPKSLI